MVARRLVVLNFEGVITTNADPYAFFIEKAAKLGIRDGDVLRKERLLRPKRNVLPTISRLMDSMCRKSEMELQKISEQFAMDTAVFPGIKTLLETVQKDETVDVLIISDFNNVMLEQTLVAKKMVLMASSRSDLCAARLLRRKDFVCTPVDSELAHILTKVSKIERIVRRALQNSRIRVEMKHTMIYSDPEIVLRILRNSSVDSPELGSGFITVVNEKHARLHGVPLNLLPSSKLKRIQQIEESFDHKNGETEGMLKVSPPFTVGTFGGCSLREESVSARNVDNKMLDPASDSARFTSWMKCIRNIMDALDHFKNENSAAVQETVTMRERNSDYFCRRRGPSDMPRGNSTPV
ncbi:hypothetical protein Tcan_18559 [Toxocara canis]|uniref:Uncharacterized protein n=1 Tax=Toxocara canis TaxID=6265 RepID=A0A0B2UW31_TOXCA|nr:hypothetical protein Tcan_18559 [Toxocara canis]